MPHYSSFTDKKICIIGGTGSLGHALANHYRKSHLYIISRDELKQFHMRQRYPDISFHLGDMRNKNRLSILLSSINPHIILICGALKHIDVCEDNISECISTNILGVQNIIEITQESRDVLFNLEIVLQVSTDKSCSPTSVYGMSKAIAERIVVDASKEIPSHKRPLKYLCVRYGNVLNSRGSIIPKFLEIGKNPDATSFQVTDHRTTRFFMTLEQSVHLIETAIIHGCSGDTWVPCAPSFKIHDLAQYFSELYHKPLIDIPLRPGEKLHESLINDTEALRTLTTHICNICFYVIKPCYQNVSVPNPINEYTSETVGSKEDMVALLNVHL